jgi:hypothetical protein
MVTDRLDLRTERLILALAQETCFALVQTTLRRTAEM